SFLPDEDRPGAEQTVILSYALWQRKFGADPNIIGQRLILDGDGYTVLAVLPRSFQFAPMGQAELWVPLRPYLFQVNKRYMHWLDVIARLKPDVTIEQARAQMDTIAARIEKEAPESHTGAGIKIVPLHDQVVGSVRPVLIILLCAVGLVLLIACANVANLLLVRASARRKEIGIRLALGATRWRLVRQLLSESLLLSVAGASVGLLLAEWGIEFLIAVIPASQLTSMPYLEGLTINARTFCYAGALSLVTGIIFGLAPAWQSSKLDLQAAIKNGGRSSAGAGRNRIRSLLVVSEIALAMVLLVGAGLMIKSTLRLLEVKLGFNPENLMTMQLELPGSKYSEDNRGRVFNRQLLERLEALPGISSVATINWTPMQPGPGDRFIVEGQPLPPPGQEPGASARVVSSNYFHTMSVSLIHGRYFTDRDNETSPNVLIINNTLRNRLYGDQDAIGRRITFGGDEPKTFEIVGVVDDERINALDEEPAALTYRPFLQEPWNKLNLVVRTKSDPESITSAVRSEVQAIDPDLALYSVATMKQLIIDTPQAFLRRYPALLMGVFAAVALVLASVGIYGIISYSVSQRTSEIGIRMALGAQRRDIFKLIVGEGLMLILIGIGIGLAAAIGLTRFLSSLLFGVSATDPLTFIVISLILAGVALGACFVPARRATKVNPMVALRYE
ncbi:MAG TPA: ABC transporter permease, partial [Blastocatellia bacterium]|nr:ABC transporter permease [Blastocatellia bacterium]